MSNSKVKLDWGAGVHREPHLTPAGLRRSALLALENAKQWADTAESLLLKAQDLEDNP